MSIELEVSSEKPPAPAKTPGELNVDNVGIPSTLRNMFRGAVADAGVDIPEKKQKVTQGEETVAKPNGEPEIPTPDETLEVKQDTTPETVETPPEEVTPEPEPEPEEEEEETPASKKWKELSKGHQSRADKLFEENKKLKDENAQLGQFKEITNAFQQDPLGFLERTAPEVVDQIRGSSLESYMQEVRHKLDEEVRKVTPEFVFDGNDAWLPGTLSYQYRTRLQAAEEEYRNRGRRRQEELERTIQVNQTKIGADKARLMAEFHLTEADIVALDEQMNKLPVTYYDLAKGLLVDKIVAQRLANIPPPEQPPNKRVITGGGGAPPSKKKEEKKRSPEMALYYKRMGIKPPTTTK